MIHHRQYLPQIVPTHCHDGGNEDQILHHGYPWILPQWILPWPNTQCASLVAPIATKHPKKKKGYLVTNAASEKTWQLLGKLSSV